MLVNGAAEVQQTYREEEKALCVTLGGESIQTLEIRVKLPERAVQGPDKLRQIFTILQHAQIEYELKDRIYEAVNRGRDTAKTLAALAELGVEPSLYGAVAEILTMDL